MTARARLLVALLAIGALMTTVAGCGGDSEDKIANGSGSSTTATNETNGGGTNTGGGGTNTGGGGPGPVADNEVMLGPALSCYQGKCPPVEFGAVELGDTSEQTFSPYSTGKTREITAISIDGPNAGDFKLDLGTCAIGTELGPGERCTLRITFAPTAEGTRTADLSIDFTDVSQEGSGSGGKPLEGIGGSAPPPPPPPPSTATSTAPDQVNE